MLLFKGWLSSIKSNVEKFSEKEKKLCVDINRLFPASSRTTLRGMVSLSSFWGHAPREKKWEIYRFFCELEQCSLAIYHGTVVTHNPIYTAYDKTVNVNSYVWNELWQTRDLCSFFIPQAPYEKHWYRLRGVKSGELQLAFKYTSPKVQTCREIVKSGTVF